MAETENVRPQRVERFDDPAEQAEIVSRAGKLWRERERFGISATVSLPQAGFFPNGREIMGATEVIPAADNYSMIGAIQGTPELIAASTQAMKLLFQGKNSLLATAWLPQLRTEREIPAEKSKMAKEMGFSGTEMPILDYTVFSLAQVFKHGFMTIESHCAGLEFYGNQYGLPVLSLSAMPILIGAAYQELPGWLNETEKIAVAGTDLGSYAMVNQVAHLCGGTERGVVTLQGNKKNSHSYEPEDLDRVKGRNVAVGDDVLESGKTFFTQTIPELLGAGAEAVIGFITHTTNFTYQTVENFAKVKEKAVLVISNSINIDPALVEQIRREKLAIISVDVMEPLRQAVLLDIEGKLADVHTNPKTQRMLMAETGLTVAGYYVPQFRRH